MQDHYGNPRGTHSADALEQYCLGVDRSLAGQPGAAQAFSAAITLDPNFAVAHADLARTLQITSQLAAARQSLASARELTQGIDDTERRHVELMGRLIEGQPQQALTLIKEQLQHAPRDVMALQPGCGVFGLIGFSGRDGREAENLAFMESVAGYYVDDWWFESQMAFSLCEVGQLDAAATLIEKAYAANPNNGNAVHHRAHIHYETGEQKLGRSLLAASRARYPRDGILDCHLAWHQALWALEAGDQDEVWALVAADIGLERTTIPPINLVTDMVALLLRAELGGFTRQPELWRQAADFAQQYFAKPGLSFADYHCAIAFALDDRQAQLAELAIADRGVACDLVGSIAQAFAAFASEQWQQMLDCLTPIMSSHERLGGSRAQRDLLELSYAFALVKLGNDAEAQRFLAQRRPVCLATVLLG